MSGAVAERAPTPGRWWSKTENGRFRCELCPRDCTLSPGQRGFCFVREATEDGIALTTYGRASGFCVDPIEKKPLYHFHPGSAVLSFGTAGCNLGCKFCQNWDISKSREMDTLADEASPSQIADAAARAGCTSVAFTYNDPVIFAEYAIDTARACRERGLKAVAVTAGYISEGARGEFFGAMDAANVDLKAFTERFYKSLCFAELGPVLETLKFVARETACWLEVTTLLIPGENDSDDEVARLSAWCAKELGPEVPLHFSAFHPDFKVKDKGPTPSATVRRAREIAKREGLRHVYTGNIHDPEGQSTTCAACGAVVIARDGYDVLRYALDEHGRCACGATLAGRFGELGHWGSRRKRLKVA